MFEQQLEAWNTFVLVFIPALFVYGGQTENSGSTKDAEVVSLVTGKSNCQPVANLPVGLYVLNGILLNGHPVAAGGVR